MGEKLTNISINVAPLTIIHAASVKLAFLNRAKNWLKGVKTEDGELESANAYVLRKIKEAVGE